MPAVPRNVFTAAACICMLSLPAFSKGPALGLGDPAPAFQVKWVKGEPIKALDKDMIYVIEFWATWCGPCRAAMPHLSELARAYSGKAVFIGVNIYEKGGKDKPYESHFPAVKAFVDGMGDKMDYRIAMDLNDRPMAKGWMEAAGRDGIPASFVVKDGRILWIGHPSGLDKVLEEIRKGTYNLSTQAQTLKQETVERQASSKFIEGLEKELDAALAAKDYKKANALFERETPSLSPEGKFLFQFMKLTTLMTSDTAKGMAFARETSAKDPELGSRLILTALLMGEKLPAAAYTFCLEILEARLRKPDSPKAMTYHMMAMAKAGLSNFPEAAAMEKRAIEIAKAANASGDKKEAVGDDFMKDFEKSLADYLARVPGATKS